MNNKDRKKEMDLDENQLAKSIIDEIIEETESEDFDKKKAVKKDNGFENKSKSQKC